MIEISQINLSDTGKFRRFLPKSPTNPNCIWFGASINDVPCGVLLSSKNSDNKETCDLNYLFVHPAIRREGIATCLFNEFRKYYKDKGYKKFCFNSVTEKENLDGVNAFLKYLGYKPVEIVANIYSYNDTESVWYSKLIKQILNSKVLPPENIEILPLNEVNSILIDDLNKQIGKDFPKHYSLFPTDMCSCLNHKNTFVAIADKKEIIGWLVALDIAGQSIYYKTLYVKEAYRKYAVGFFLMSTGLKNHSEKYHNVPALYGVSLKNPNAEKFYSTYFQQAHRNTQYEFILESYL